MVRTSKTGAVDGMTVKGEVKMRMTSSLGVKGGSVRGVVTRTLKEW